MLVCKFWIFEGLECAVALKTQNWPIARSCNEILPFRWTVRAFEGAGFHAGRSLQVCRIGPNPGLGPEGMRSLNLD